jgi:hypothetical protein
MQSFDFIVDTLDCCFELIVSALDVLQFFG